LAKYWFKGNFAVETGREATTLAEVIWRAEALIEKGYDPILAHTGDWVLLIDGFESRQGAVQQIETKLAGGFPNWAFEAVALSGKYVSVSLGTVRQFVYDSASGNLRATPTGQGAEGAAGAAASGSVSAAGGTDIPPAAIQLNGKPYRGTIELVRGAASGDMSAVNVLTMNEYLYGVVPREIEASSSPEALKAQAVAARTYAMNTIGKHKEFGFDLCSTQDCQAYGGLSWEDARSSAAVDATEGRIVTWQGAPAQIFYFSSSGGHTEDVKNVWGSAFPYLEGVEDLYEAGNSYHYNWETVYTAREIKARLLENEVDIGDVRGVAVTKTSDAGRAIEVTITGTKGKKVYQNGACRTFLPNLFSQMYSISGGSGSGGGDGGASVRAVDASGTLRTIGITGKTAVSGADGANQEIKGNGGSAVSAAGIVNFPATGASFRFVGKGWGHGVGMSQEGAKGMADAGFSYSDILLHYFPGCVVE
jgi:stage II sporulation protein D